VSLAPECRIHHWEALRERRELPTGLSALCDVDPTGASHNIVDGIVRSVAQPDEFAAQNVDLWLGR
jgi:hypothetical protein